MSDVNMKPEKKDTDEEVDDLDDKSSKHSVPSPTDSCSSKDSQNDNLDTSDCNMKNEDSGKRQKSYSWHRRKVSTDSDSKKSSLSSYCDRNNFYLKISNFPTSWSFGQIKDFILKEYGPVENIYMASDKEKHFVGMVKLEFTTFIEIRKAWEKLNGKIVEDSTLIADTGDTDDEDFMFEDSSPPKKKKRNPDTIWRPDIDVWETDPKGLYGFKPAFLKSLDITPPIDKWVHVTNFRCDKSELKEVLELAGEVLICKVDTRFQRFAKAMYSHPIEAVQAVSMLNNQEFYGQVLKVTIDRCPVGTVFLPKGLQAVGPGLGMAGKPLRDVVKQYERFVNHKSSFVNPTIFRNPDLLFSSNEDVSKIYVPKRLDELHSSTANLNNYVIQSNFDENIESKSFSEPAPPGTKGNFNRSPGTVGFSPTPGSGAIRPVGPMSMPVRPIGPPGPMTGPRGPMAGMTGPRQMPGPVGPIGSLPGQVGPVPGQVGPIPGQVGPIPGQVGPIPGQVGPIPGQIGPIPGPVGPIGSSVGALPSTVGPMAHSGGPMPGPRPVLGPRPMPGYNGGNPMPHQMSPRPNDCNTVELSNLPLSTTFQLLSEKMAQCGQVLSLQLTSPGCAVVQFSQSVQADRCYQQYNNCRVLGNIISVKYL